MRILLLGASGQLGYELKIGLSKVGELKACERIEVDFMLPDSIRFTIQSFKPEYIVNAAAYTAVDKAEVEKNLAFKINAEAVAIIAEEAKKINALLIHYSTDYVFDGKKTDPYNEQDKAAPINVYGQSKLAGEEAILASACRHIIFRTSWVIGRHGHNFVKSILRLAQQRDSLSVVDDQYGVPTTTEFITQVTRAAILGQAKSAWDSGLYHLTPNGKTSWYGVARKVLLLAKKHRLHLNMNEKALLPIDSSTYSTLAVRPSNSLLNTDKLENLLDFEIESWERCFLKVTSTIIEDYKLA